MAGHISQEAADTHARRTPARRPWGASATSLPTLQGLVRTTRPRRENVKRWGHRNCSKSLSRVHTYLLSRLHANLPVQHVGIQTSTKKTQKSPRCRDSGRRAKSDVSAACALRACTRRVWREGCFRRCPSHARLGVAASCSLGATLWLTLMLG